MAKGSEQPPQVSEQNLLMLARALVRGGMDTKDVAELFGSSLGVPTGSPNYDQLFAQYMPTFVQVNQSEPENSIRRSIAKEVMDGTPVWQITEGIANAIERGDAGVTPGSTLEELSRFAETLQREYRSYTEASGKAENKSVLQEYGLPDPNARYTVQEMFPDVMGKLLDLEKQNPTYTMGAVGSGAKLPPRVSGGRTGVVASGSDAAALLKLATSAMNRAEDLSVGGRTYDPAEIRDELIPQLKEQEAAQSSQSKQYSNLLKRWERSQQTKIKAAERLASSASSQRNSEIAAAQERFQFGGSSEEFKNAMTQINRKYEDTLNTVERLKSEQPPSDFYSLLDMTVEPDVAEEEKAKKKNFSSPSAVTSRRVSTLSGPGGYVGPAGGESTMARTFDPYWNQVAKGVVSGLQEKIDKSGRTPYLDSLNRLALFSKFVKGK